MRRTTLNRKTASLAARLERLERLLGKDSCPQCRLNVRHSLSDPSKTKLEDLDQCIPAMCQLCDQARVVDISDEPGDLVEMFRIFYGSTLEKQFTDLRAWAASEWHVHRRTAHKLYEPNCYLFTIRKQYPPPDRHRGRLR